VWRRPSIFNGSKSGLDAIKPSGGDIIVTLVVVAGRNQRDAARLSP
jgi:hypothetical protein